MPLIKLNDRSIKDVTSLPFGVGTLIHIQSQTASNSASISFTTGINSTYKEYQFYFIDIHPRTDNTSFTFNLSIDAGSNYNVTKTSTNFQAYHFENDSDQALGYVTANDLAQSTAYQPLLDAQGNGADECCVGSMSLFNPSSTTYVKHYIANCNRYYNGDASVNHYTGGYANTTSAVNAISFKFDTGNFDGTIAMFGVL